MRRLLSAAPAVASAVTLAVALAVAVAVAVAVAATDPAAASTTGSASNYVPVAPQRLLDTRSSTPVAGRAARRLAVPSSAVPTGSVAVVLNVTVTGPTAGGYLTVYAAAQDRPAVSNVNFVAGQTVPNLVVSQLGTANSVDFYNGSTGATNVVVDLAGYFRAPGLADQGYFDPVTPSRLLDTRAGTGAPKAAVAPHGVIDLTVAGRGGVPDGVSAVVLNVTATQPKAPGYVTVYPSGAGRPTASNLNFPAGQTVPNLVLAPVGSDGNVELYNGASSTVQLLADVSGYLLGGDPVGIGGIGSLTPARLLDTRASAAIGAGKTRVLAVAGYGGVPSAHVSAVVVNLTATGSTASGAITAYSGGTPPNASNVNYRSGQTVANLASVKLGTDGTLTFYNRSSGSVQLIVDVAGYVLDFAAPLPASTTSRYVSDLTAISDPTSTGEGCTDATQQPRLVLLDVGAQTITAPLSAANPGVALVFSVPTRRVAYPALVAALDGYLAGFAACMTNGQAATIAVGTNNDGAFSEPDAYLATTRGTDWADKVVDSLAQHAGITIAGANDIESDFASTEAQAEQWVTAFLSNTTASFVYNGAASNCPTAYGSTAECGPVRDDNGVTKTWTRAQYVRLTYGLGPTRISVLPQIYLEVQAVQWRNLDITSGSRLAFAGSLTEDVTCGGCDFTPSQGWAALYHALSTRATPPSLPVATDLAPH